MYIRNHKKVLSGRSFFRLIAVDLIRVKTPLKNGICNHPKERVQQWLRNQEAVESFIKKKKNQQGAPNDDSNAPENDWENNQQIALQPPLHLLRHYYSTSLSPVSFFLCCRRLVSNTR